MKITSEKSEDGWEQILLFFLPIKIVKFEVDAMLKHIIILVFLFASQGVIGQTPLLKDSILKSKKSFFPERPFIIKTDISAPWIYSGDDNPSENIFGRAFSMTLECLFKKKHSVQLTILGYGSGWNSYESPINSYSIGKTRGIQLVPEYKFFVSRKRRNSGYFIGIYGLYQHEKEVADFYWGRGAFYYVNGVYHQYPTTPEHNVEYTNNMAFGIMNGVQFYIIKRIVIEALAGLTVVDFYPGQYMSGAHYWNIEYINLYPRLALNFGYRLNIKPKPPAVPEIPWD